MKKLILPFMMAALGFGAINAGVKIGETEYTTLNEAVTAAADGDEITITGVTEVEKTIDLTKSVIIAGGDEDAQLKRKEGKSFAIMLKFSKGSESAVVKNLTVSGSTVNVNGTTVEMNYDCRSNSTQALLQNVTFIECVNTNTNNQGIICVKGNGRLTLDGVKIVDASTPNFTKPGTVFCGNGDDITLKGDNEISLNLEGRIKVDGELTNTTPIPLYIIKNINVGGLIVMGYHDTSKFKVFGAENTRLTDGRDGLMYSSFIPAVKNVATNEQFTTLAEAIATIADGDNNFELLEDVTIDTRMIPVGQINVSFTGKDGVKTITRGNFKTDWSTFEMSGSSKGTMAFSNVHFVNTNADVKNAMLVAQGGNVVLNNVSEAFETNTSWNLQVKSGGHATATDTQLRKVLVNSRGHLGIDGNINMNITLQDSAADLYVVEGGELTNEQRIGLTYQTLPEVGTVVVKNCVDSRRFYVNHPGYSLSAADGNLVLAAKPEAPVVEGLGTSGSSMAAGEKIVVTAPEGFLIYYKELDYVAPENEIRLLAEGDLLDGYTATGVNKYEYTVPSSAKQLYFVAAKEDGSQASEPLVFAVANGTVTGVAEVEADNASAPVESVSYTHLTLPTNSRV